MNELSSSGFRPNLSDHGPIKKLKKAGIMLSKIARHMNILAAYDSNSSSMYCNGSAHKLNRPERIRMLSFQTYLIVNGYDAVR